MLAESCGEKRERRVLPVRFGNLHDVREGSEVRVTILVQRIGDIPWLVRIEMKKDFSFGPWFRTMSEKT